MGVVWDTAAIEADQTCIVRHAPRRYPLQWYRLLGLPTIPYPLWSRIPPCPTSSGVVGIIRCQYRNSTILVLDDHGRHPESGCGRGPGIARRAAEAVFRC